MTCCAEHVDVGVDLLVEAQRQLQVCYFMTHGDSFDVL